MLLAFLVLISLLSSVSLAISPRKVTRAVTSMERRAGRPTYECFEHSHATSGHLDSTSRSDCAKGLKRIMAADKAKAPMVFSRTPGVGYHVPQEIESGTCVIHFDIAEDEENKGTDVQMPMEAIVAGALHIMENCLNDPPDLTGLGGHAFALSRSGSGGSLALVIFGKPPPVAEPPPMPTLRMVFPSTEAIANA